MSRPTVRRWRLVVPPTVHRQYQLNSFAGGDRISRIHAQFDRSWPGPGYYDPRGFQPTPRWPTDTEQFGDYYVRGPRR